MNNDELPNDVSFHCLMRWLSISNVLGRFFWITWSNQTIYGRKRKIFLWISWTAVVVKFSFFFADVVKHIQKPNIYLQGKEKLISDLVQTVFNFYRKLKLFRKDLLAKIFAHFKYLKKISESLPEIRVKTEDYLSKICLTLL